MRQHILVVEDSELVVGALRLLLEAMERRVSIAHTVESAIAAVETDPPDVILLDLTLPDGTGLTVAQHVQSHGSGAIVIAMTGHDSDDVAADCRAAGCRDVLIKPVSIRLLRDVLTGL